MQQGVVVVNPSKFKNLNRLKTDLNRIFHDYGWAEPIWLETTVEDPGVGQAQTAVGMGVDLVCALGGDGTQRCVAQGLAGTGMPMGILAAGTGNLLARNLNLPYRRYADGLRVALGGRDHRIDVSMIELDVDGVHRWTAPQVGLVMTGVGLDAEILAEADDELKSRFGWLAYPAAGIRHVAHDRMHVTIALDGREPDAELPVSSVLIGNCGLLAGGLRLMPNAEVDDGVLDTAVLRPKGLLGWAPLVAQVATGARRETMTIGRLRSTSIEVRSKRPVMIEVDGDVLARAYAVRVTVDPLAATVRVPR